MKEYPRKYEIDSFITSKEAKEIFSSVLELDQEMNSLLKQIEALKEKQQAKLEHLASNGWHYFKTNGIVFCLHESESPKLFYLTSEILLDLDEGEDV